MGCVTSRDVQAPVPLQLQQATGVKGSPAEKRVHPKSASAPLKTKKGSGPVLLSSPTDIRTSTDFQIPAGGDEENDSQAAERRVSFESGFQILPKLRTGRVGERGPEVADPERQGPSWDGARSVQARVQDIEEHVRIRSKLQASPKPVGIVHAPKVASKPVSKAPTSSAGPRQDLSMSQPFGTPANTLDSDSAQTHLRQLASLSQHKTAQMDGEGAGTSKQANTPANTLDSDSAQTHLKQLANVSQPMTDDTAKIELGSLDESWASATSAPTPMGTMTTLEAGSASAAAMQAAAKKSTSQQDAWGILGLASAPKHDRDTRMKPSQLTDTIDSLNQLDEQLDDPLGFPNGSNLADTAYDLSDRMPADGALGDSDAGPNAPPSTWNDSSAGTRYPDGLHDSNYSTDQYIDAEGPGVRFKEGADSMINDNRVMDYRGGMTGDASRYDDDDGEDSRGPGGRAATGYAAQSPRPSGAWQTQMGSVAGWQALASDIMNETEEEEQEEDNFQSANDMGSVGPKIAPLAEAVIQPSGGFFVQYSKMEALGAGAFGTAYKARRRKDGAIVVVKVMHASAMSLKARQEAKNEVNVLSALNHPNVVRYYECFAEEHSNMQIVMELCEEGDLDSFLKNRNGRLLEEKEIMLLFVQICLGLQHVHTKGIIHRDLKCGNCFCCANGIVKLGDFGISRALDVEEQMAKTFVGTPYYMSPELLQGKKYNSKSDVWAVGCILYELCTLRRAFEANTFAVVNIKILSGKYPPIAQSYSPELRALIAALLSLQPIARPNLQAVLDLAFVRKHLQAYRGHIVKNVRQRRASFYRSVEAFADPEAGEPSSEFSAASGSASQGQQQQGEKDSKPSAARPSFFNSMLATPEPKPVTKTLAEQKAAVLASAALKKAQRRQARQQEEADNLEILRHSRQAEDALAAAAAESQASQPQLGLEAFMRPVESDALGGTLDSPPTSGQVTQSDAAPVLQQQHQAAKESVANVLEQLDDIMQAPSTDKLDLPQIPPTRPERRRTILPGQTEEEIDF